jgi:PAS domain S-box-containing protein
LALGIFFCALLLRCWILPLEAGLPFLFFYPGAVLAFYLCGMGPGRLTIVLGALAGYYVFEPPYWSFTPSAHSVLSTSVFVASAYWVGRIVEQLQANTSQLRSTLSALGGTEERLRAVTDHLPALVSYLDRDLRFRFVNRRYQDWFGKPPASMIGLSLRDFYGEEVWAEIEPYMRAALGGREVMYEREMAMRSGRRHVQATLVPHRDEEGNVLGLYTLIGDITPRHDAEQALKETTHRLQLVLDGLPARISYWDLDQLNRFANKVFLDAFGVTQSAIGGRHAREIMGEDWYTRIEASIGDALSGQDRQLEASSVGADGIRRYMDLRFAPDVTEGQVRGLFVFGLDITARRQAERDLADRERRLKLLVDGVREYAIYMLDAQGRVTIWNAGAERNKGYRAEEVIGQHFSNFFIPEDVALGKPEQELAQAARDGRFETEDWRRRGDGSRFWASVLLTAIYDDDQQLIGYAKITRDLTEKRRQQDLLVRVAEAAPCAMLMVGADGLIALVNAQAEVMFGYTRAEMLGQSVEMLIPLRWRDSHPALRKGYVSNATVRPMGLGRKLQALHKDGREFPVDIGLSPIDAADGPATLAAIFDITERRRQQAATEQALAEKEILLKELYHRVKNNLQVVQSLLNLQRRALPDGVARVAIDQSVQRVQAIALVHEKLYQSGNLAAVSLRNYARDLMHQIAEANRTDGRVIKLHAEVSEVETGLDTAVPFGLLLTELISNCLKHAFSSRSSGDVWVRLVREEDGYRLTVADNGVGFPEDFDSTADTNSMGLKLATGLARQLGGKLQIGGNAGGAVLNALLTRL